MTLVIPIPRTAVTVRPATMDDLSFIDGLQKMHSKQVGWMPTKQLEGKINAGQVLVADEGGMGLQPMSCSEDTGCKPVPLGYCIGQDQYFKRDDVGIIYQLNVLPMKQRSFIGATLLKAMFDRAAYGCRLFCCWCAQDIEANRFWESLGFIPLAFRAGSSGKRRVHIFWQRRIRPDDCETPYWFPSQTSSGAIREDRLVLPIPPGTHWSDAKPIILPGETEQKQIAGTPRKKAAGKKSASPALDKYNISGGGLRPVVAQPEKKRSGETPKPRKKLTNDPKHVAAARELRDRWLEQVNRDGFALAAQGGQGKYDVSRQLAAPAPEPGRIPLLIEQTPIAA